MGSPLGEGCFQSFVVLSGPRVMRDVGDVIGAPAMPRDGAESLAGTRSPDVLPAQQRGREQQRWLLLATAVALEEVELVWAG